MSSSVETPFNLIGNLVLSVWWWWVQIRAIMIMDGVVPVKMESIWPRYNTSSILCMYIKEYPLFIFCPPFKTISWNDFYLYEIAHFLLFKLMTEDKYNWLLSVSKTALTQMIKLTDTSVTTLAKCMKNGSSSFQGYYCGCGTIF